MGGKSSKSRSSSSSSRQTRQQPSSISSPAAPQSAQRVAQSLRETPASPRPNIWGDLITANGVYPGSAQFPDEKIAQLISAGKLAPRWRPVDEDEPPEDLKVTECPLCFNAYGGPMNSTACCSQEVCTECVVFMQTPSRDKPCPFCQRDSFWVEFAGVPVEDAHVIHATTISASAAKDAPAQPQGARSSAAGASGGSQVPPPSPVITASVAQRRALEAQLEAQHQADLAADLQRARNGSPISRPAQQVRSSPLTDPSSDRFSLPRAASASGPAGSTRRAAAAAAAAAARQRHGDTDRFERYTRRTRGRGHGSQQREASAMAELFGGGGSMRSLGGDDDQDMDVLERMMVMQAMRASLMDAGGDASSGRGPSHAAAQAQPHEETPMHGLLQALGSLLQARHEATGHGGALFSPMDSEGARPRRRSSSSVDD